MDFFEMRLVLAVLLACQVAGFLVLANITSYWQVFLFALLYGTAFGGFNPGRAAILSTYFGSRNFGAIHGLAQSATVLGGMIGPILMGLCQPAHILQMGATVSDIVNMAAIAAHDAIIHVEPQLRL